jgi:hypothetical protein
LIEKLKNWKIGIVEKEEDFICFEIEDCIGYSKSIEFSSTKQNITS